MNNTERHPARSDQQFFKTMYSMHNNNYFNIARNKPKKSPNLLQNPVRIPNTDSTLESNYEDPNYLHTNEYMQHTSSDFKTYLEDTNLQTGIFNHYTSRDINYNTPSSPSRKDLNQQLNFGLSRSPSPLKEYNTSTLFFMNRPINLRLKNNIDVAYRHLNVESAESYRNRVKTSEKYRRDKNSSISQARSRSTDFLNQQKILNKPLARLDVLNGKSLIKKFKMNNLQEIKSNEYEDNRKTVFKSSDPWYVKPKEQIEKYTNEDYINNVYITPKSIKTKIEINLNFDPIENANNRIVTKNLVNNNSSSYLMTLKDKAKKGIKNKSLEIEVNKIKDKVK